MRENARVTVPRAEPVPGLVLPDPVRAGAPAASGFFSYLVDAVRLRPAGRRTLTVLSALMLLGGTAVMGYPIASDVYAEQVVQDRLETRFQAQVTTVIDEAIRPGEVGIGDPLTRIVMPGIGVDAIVVEGTSQSALRAGAGHYPNTPLPGAVGNVGIAGHRTTFGRPFSQIDQLEPGQEIRLETPFAEHVYRVIGAPQDAAAPCRNGACWVTHPRDWGVVAPSDTALLTLTTCHPKGSARERLILRAELVDTRPVTAS